MGNREWCPLEELGVGVDDDESCFMIKCVEASTRMTASVCWDS